MYGGHLVIGVKDKTLEIVGTDTYNYDRQKAILRLKDGVQVFLPKDLTLKNSRRMIPYRPSKKGRNSLMRSIIVC